jgi:hypothetical protein
MGKLRAASVVLGVMFALPSCQLEDEAGLGSSQHATTVLNELHLTASHNTYEEPNTPNSPTVRQIKWHFRQQTDEEPENPTATMHLEIDIRGSIPFAAPQTPNTNWWVAHDPITTEITPHCGAQGGLLTDCLNSIESYHDNNPSHPFISIWIDVKTDWVTSGPVQQTPSQLDQRISDRFGAGELFTPSDLCSTCTDTDPTLREAVVANGWPTDDALVGQIMFVLTAESNSTGNGYLADYAERPSGTSLAFVAPFAGSASEVTGTPVSFSSGDWVVIYNFDWADPDDDGTCDNETPDAPCEFLDNAAAEGFLTRAYDLDDADEESEASMAGANFLPVNCPWLSGQDRYEPDCDP